MNSIRYIITRSCLQDGSMRLLKYNEGHFPQSGPAQFVDERGNEHTVQVDREHMRVTGLAGFYHDLNLGVNDVMLLTPLAAGRYQVEAIVKPHPIAAPSRPAAIPAPEARRVVVSSTPHVREVRLQHAAPATGSAVASPAATPTPLFAAPTRPEPAPETGRDPVREVAAIFGQGGQGQPNPERPSLPEGPRPMNTEATQRENVPAAPQFSGPSRPEDQVAEFARLTGYTLDYPATGLMRLSAELGPQYGYSVLIAADPLAMTQDAWENAKDESRFLITHENERPEGLNRLTREALATLVDHAHLAPLSPVDMRGYWRAGSIDLASAASITELVSAHLAQRGTFTFVLMSLAQQPANSIVNVNRLAERLGSGVNKAELGTILETLSRPPFLALTPLPGGQYLLRTDVPQLLGDLSEYSIGVRRRTATTSPQSEPVPVHREASSKVHA